ncbi:MAG: hypothetical protein AMDU2_EPLC00011G0018 [Thermoplasmatales archaeon E-plasma]|jgi:hypothetical protein|nr:MAG: hypothetical protein AMDU2_EPLC00011G0018 [Thermoplasmatales archaeon E-plasma]
MVAGSISPKGEMIRNSQQEVGEAHSTDDMNDSITFIEGRRLTVCKPVPNRGGLYSSIETYGGMRI